LSIGFFKARWVCLGAYSGYMGRKTLEKFPKHYFNGIGFGKEGGITRGHY